MDVSGRVLHGTCGWSDPSIVSCGRFYPASVRTSAEKLEVHSHTFGCVEVDSSLYSIPSPFNVQKWVDSVPKDYVFHFKAFGLFCSHNGCPTNALPRRVREQLASYLLAKPTVTLKDLPAAAVKSVWAAFRACVEPAVKAKKMGCVIFQLPLSFLPTDENRRHIEWCRSQIHSSLEMAVEFRARSWFSADTSASTVVRILPTWEWLRSLNVALIAADELVHETLPHSRPPASRPAPLMPIALHVVHPRFFYIRLHRRQGEKERLLVESEHADWASRIDTLRRQLKGPVYFLWGTDWEDAPVVNAKQLQASLPDSCRFDWPKHVRQQTAKKRHTLTSLLSGAANKVAKVAQAGRSSLPAVGSAGFRTPNLCHQLTSVASGSAGLSNVSAHKLSKDSDRSHPLRNPSERASLPAGSSAGIAQQAHVHSHSEHAKLAGMLAGGAPTVGPPLAQPVRAPGSGPSALCHGQAVPAGASLVSVCTNNVDGGYEEVVPRVHSSEKHGVGQNVPPMHPVGTPAMVGGRVGPLTTPPVDSKSGSVKKVQGGELLLPPAVSSSGCAGAAAVPRSAPPLGYSRVLGDQSHTPARRSCDQGDPLGRDAVLPRAATADTHKQFSLKHCEAACRSAPPAAAAALPALGDAGVGAADVLMQQADVICDTPEKRSAEVLNTTQCSTPELKPQSSQVSQSSIATPVTPQSPGEGAAQASNDFRDRDVAKEQLGAWGNGTRAGPPNLPGTSWFAPPTSDLARSISCTVAANIDKPSSHVTLAAPLAPAAQQENASAAAECESFPQQAPAVTVGGNSMDVGAPPGQEVHTATTNLAQTFSKLVHKVPAALRSTKPPEQKESKKVITGEMDAFLKPAGQHQHQNSEEKCLSGDKSSTTVAQRLLSAGTLQPSSLATASTHGARTPSTVVPSSKQGGSGAAATTQSVAGKSDVGGRKGGNSKASKVKAKMRDKPGGLKQATLGHFFSR